MMTTIASKNSSGQNMRSSNFELLRIICILMIGFLHTSVLAQNQQNILSICRISDIFIGSFCNVSVSCFILISGYFGIKRRLERFIQISLLTTFFSILLAILNNGINLAFIAKAILVIPAFGNWFIGCYLFLTFISPYINTFCEKISEQEFRKLILFSTLFFCIFPIITNTAFDSLINSGGKCLVYFLYLYILGRFIKKYKGYNDIRPQKFLIYYFFICSFIFVISFFFSLYAKRKVFLFSLDCSIFNLLASLALFEFFKSINIKNTLINNIASSVLTVYLLDDLRIFLDQHFFHIVTFSNSYFYILILIIEVVATFIIAVLFDKLRLFVFKNIENRMINYICSICRKLAPKLIVRFS